jgi:hypothetical protein
VIALALALARAWVRIYTCGMSPAVGQARRAEIESDLWEQRHEEQSRRRRALATTLHLLGRVIRGVPSDLSWRIEHRSRRRIAVRHHAWIVFPAFVEISYITGAARVGTPSAVDAPEQVAMALGAAAILWGVVMLWRGTAPVAAAWLVCLGALAPTLLIARIAPLSLVWAALAARSAVRRSDALRARHARVASS